MSMPELPEVETIKRELEKAIINKKIIEVIVNNPKVIREPKKEKFIAELKNVAIKEIIRRGKLLIFILSSGKSLTIHLKMTGQLIYPRQGGASPIKSTRVSFKFSDGKIMDFNDTRLFGELRIIDNWQDLKFIKELGPEPFDLTGDKFSEILGKRKTKIKILLMDQKIISGIGNLYANEALFRARINPSHTANSLSKKEKEKLFSEIKKVLHEAIRCGGSSIDQYVRVSGEPGNYAKYHKVYGRENKPCLGCKGKVKRISLGGRGTYFCPACQK
jgi:formamidopyrimidine-DNA glycosylase